MVHIMVQFQKKSNGGASGMPIEFLSERVHNNNNSKSYEKLYTLCLPFFQGDDAILIKISSK